MTDAAGTREFWFEGSIEPRKALGIIEAALDDEGLELLRAQGQRIHSVLRDEGGKRFEVVIVPLKMIVSSDLDATLASAILAEMLA